MIDLKNVRPETIEKYNDACFALFMDSMAAEQGEALMEENRRLRADESFAVPAETERRNLRFIDRAFAKKKRAANLKKLKKAGNIAAVFVAVLALSSGLLFTTVEAFRVSVLNFVMDTYDYGEGTLVKATQESATGDTSEYLKPTWVPEGYELVEETVQDNRYKIVYTNELGHTISFSQREMSSSSLVDTERADGSHEATVLNFRALVTIKGSDISVWWLDTELKSIILIFASNSDESTILAIAESCYG